MRTQVGWLKGYRHVALAVGLGLLLAGQHGVQAGDAKKSDAVVKVSAAAAAPAADGSQVIQVTLTLDKDKPWHVYANPVPSKDFPGLPTTLTVEGIKPEEFKVDYPEGRLVKDADLGDYHVYEGQVTIPVTVHRAPGTAGSLAVTAKFQACWQIQDQGLCLLPTSVTVTVP